MENNSLSEYIKQVYELECSIINLNKLIGILDNKIYYITIPIEKTEEASEFLVANSEYKCSKLEALRYISAEHEYLNEIGLDITSYEYQLCEKFNSKDMLKYIFAKANLSMKKTNAFSLAESIYLNNLY